MYLAPNRTSDLFPIKHRNFQEFPVNHNADKSPPAEDDACTGGLLHASNWYTGKKRSRSTKINLIFNSWCIETLKLRKVPRSICEPLHSRQPHQGRSGGGHLALPLPDVHQHRLAARSNPPDQVDRLHRIVCRSSNHPGCDVPEFPSKLDGTTGAWSGMWLVIIHRMFEILLSTQGHLELSVAYPNVNVNVNVRRTYWALLNLVTAPT